MNKKISTLMASALLAGALVTPADLLAAIQYKVEKSYANATAVSAPDPSSDASGYMVLNISGKDYVVTVSSNAMVATPFEEALLSTSEMTIAQDGANNYTFTVNGALVGIHASSLAWAAVTDFPVSSCALVDAAPFKIGNGTNSVKLEGTTFSVAVGTSNEFAARFVSASDLEAIDATSTIDLSTDFNFGKYYVLMDESNGQAYEGQAGGTAVAKTFEADNAAFYWNVIKDKNTGYATLQNVGTEELLKVSSDLAVIELDVEGKKINNTGNVVDLLKNEDHSAVDGTVKVRFGAAPSLPLSVSDLQGIYGASFSATLKRVAGNKALENNPFTGNLVPVQWKNLSTGYALEPASSGSDFMLQNGDGKIIVMQIADKYASATGGKDYAYKVIALNPKDLATAMKGDAAAKAKYATQFSIFAPALFNAGTDEMVDRITVAFDQSVNADPTVFQLGAISLNKDDNYTLAAEKAYDGYDYLDAISIKLSKNTLINLKEVLKTPSFFTIKNVNTKKDYAAGTGTNFGKVLGLNEDGEVSYMKKDEVLVGYPETQWAITVNSDGEMVIKNRENPTAVPDNGASTTYMTLNPNNLYVVSGKANTYALIDGTSLTAVDTIEIAPVATTEADGYKRFNANALKDQLFNIGYYSAVKGVSYVTESHKNNHQVGLVNEKANSTEWRLGALMYEENDAWNNPVAYIPDTIRVESALGYWDADAKAFKDTESDDVDANNAYLKVLAYSLKNSNNDEYLKYDETDGRNRYATGLDGEKEGFKKLTDAEYFAVKMTGNDKYNLIPVELVVGDVSGTEDKDIDGYADGTKGAPYTVRAVLAKNKVYSGDSADKGILNKRGMYSKRENDLFTIEEKEAPAYLKLTQGEIIKLYRAEYTSESNVLYEKGEFLGIGNAVETPAINPALYVDTVYVNREANNRWEYLLGVNITRIDTTYKCDEPSHSHLIHRADTTKGRFLVNFADSAIVAAGKEDIHTNKYMYSDSKGDWAKLGFVPGFRTADVLSIWNGEKGKADLIEVGTPAPQLVKFAFRIVDNDAKTFVIETGYKALDEDATIDGRGYLRYDNGVVYVTDNIEDAEVFKANLDETRIPTANEGINASEVSVIASEGKVIINGAQGKAVVISNILGQTIANTVISSDNATIAAPQGVVVVAVEGEAAVKAIVK